MTHDEYKNLYDAAKKKTNLKIEPGCFVWDSAVLIAGELPTNLLEEIVNDAIIMPPATFWNPDWQKVCQNELIHRAIFDPK